MGTGSIAGLSKSALVRLANVQNLDKMLDTHIIVNLCLKGSSIWNLENGVSCISGGRAPHDIDFQQMKMPILRNNSIYISILKAPRYVHITPESDFNPEYKN